ncbi:hypothetical protein [uncultured Marinobacter sp.]|uniref:hypothetical protein n=1 Tax=uncultured Marinobacter sp. TaxID=187379 RepID=UPI00261EB7A0|nr:hypothetical protein [uncultured Marinobacter sp.]
MKAAYVVIIALLFTGSVFAAGVSAENEPGYLNYSYAPEDTGQPFGILHTGVMVAPGIYEPGYVNYRYEPSGKPGPKQARTGKWLASGVFEPTYLNYCVEPM